MPRYLRKRHGAEVYREGWREDKSTMAKSWLHEGRRTRVQQRQGAGEEKEEGQGYSSGKELRYRRRAKVQEGERLGYSSGKELGYRREKA
jgi:hypothetical protein